MPQDAFTLFYNAKELNGLLTGGKINKIVQPDKDGVLFYIYTEKRLLKLFLCTNSSFCRISFTENEKIPPAVPPNFCMLLRKHLLGAEIRGVEQVAFERIIALRLLCTSDFSCAERTLYAEIMGKYSNLVLVENGIILGALKTTPLQESARRVLFSGVRYALPDPQDKADATNPLSLRNALVGFAHSADKPRYLFDNVAGIAYDTAVRLALECEGCADPDGLAQRITAFLFGRTPAPTVLYRNGEPYDFTVCKDADGKRVESLQAAQCAVYDYREKRRALEERQRRLFSVLTARQKKTEKSLAATCERLKECENAEKYRLYGELITANIYRLQRGMSELKAVNYYEENCPECRIPLDEKLTPAQNAQRYFKRYNKLKRTLLALTPRYRQEDAELKYLQTVAAFLSLAKEPCDLEGVEEELQAYGLLKAPKETKKQEPVPFRQFEKDGFTVLAGRNNLQNDRLIRQSAPDDIWLHTQRYHSAHVVIRTQGRPVPDGVLLFAAEICAAYSDGKRGGKIPVDYCLKKFVRKPSGGKAGFVVYTDFKTILVDRKE